VLTTIPCILAHPYEQEPGSMHTQPEGVRYSPSDFAHTTKSMGSGGTMPGQTFHHTNEPQDFSLSGPQALRSFFFPRQTVQIQEAARILGIGREAVYKRIWKGNDTLKISKTGSGRQFILLEDLIFYLYPSPSPSVTSSLATSSSTPSREPGRPRKSVSNNGGGFR